MGAVLNSFYEKISRTQAQRRNQAKAQRRNRENSTKTQPRKNKKSTKTQISE